MDYIYDFPVISGGMDRPMSLNMVGAMSHSRPPPAKEETGVSATGSYNKYRLLHLNYVSS